jgi:hypothetical protein
MESIVVFAAYDSIRCGVENGGYRGSDQGESAAFLSSQLDPKTTNRGGLWPRETLEAQGCTERSTGETLSAKYGFGAVRTTRAGKKNAGLKAATLISVSNPVSQVLW